MENNMIFEIKEYCVEEISQSDINDIVEIYNSNQKFLENHLKRRRVTNEWYEKELKDMKDVVFKSCKIVDKKTRKIIGLLDFKIEKESYLSILMIHDTYKKQGVGRLIYKKFEEYLLSKGVCSIRIDVVINYDKDVIMFWSKLGYVENRNIELDWCGNKLSAIVIKKDIMNS